MVRFVIVRHGYSQGNKENRFSGQMDVPLDDVGRKQAKCTAEFILNHYRVDNIYSSDLRRAYDTVKPIADTLGLEVIQSKDLREVDVGTWQGRLIEEIKREYPESFERYRKYPGLSNFGDGESYADVQHRALRFLSRTAMENDGKTVVIGTHGGVIRTLRAAWTSVKLEEVKRIPHVPNGSVTVVDYDYKTWNIIEVGYTDHLTDKITEEGVK